MRTRPDTNMPERTVTVLIPGGPLKDIGAVNKIVANLMGQLGHPGCFSGFDIRFLHEMEFRVNPQTHEVHGVSTQG
jgi:hypothetical protein